MDLDEILAPLLIMYMTLDQVANFLGHELPPLQNGIIIVCTQKVQINIYKVV